MINRGFSITQKKWKEAEGKAYFVREQDEGYLKVSFFGPFYGSYIVFGLDKENYQYAFVAGPDTSYLWLLSRTATVKKEVVNQFEEQAQRLGFNTEKLTFVDQSTQPE